MSSFFKELALGCAGNMLKSVLGHLSYAPGTKTITERFPNVKGLSLLKPRGQLFLNMILTMFSGQKHSIFVRTANHDVVVKP